jgi:hypothetical protein
MLTKFEDYARNHPVICAAVGFGAFAILGLLLFTFLG